MHSARGVQRVQWICFARMQELHKIIGQLTEERTQQLLLFKTSERYLDRVTSALQQKAGQEAKFRR